MNLFQRSKTATTISAHRAAGDTARDKRAWDEAEREYRLHLNKNKKDADIWVQYGHSLKEQGKFEAAENAYRRAIRLRPNDDDAALHLGHLLKKIGRSSEATAAFGRVLEITGSQEAYAELSGLSGGKEFVRRISGGGSPSISGSVVFFEIDDLLGYLDAHKTLSGIQRVQVGVIRHVLSNTSEEEKRHMFVLNPKDSDTLWSVNSEDLEAIIDCLSQSFVDHGDLRLLVADARRHSVSVTPERGQIIFVLGAFWGHGSVGSRYFNWKKKGVIIGAYIYDIIPITHSEYCDNRLSHEFKLSFGDALSTFDFFLTISDFTKIEIEKYVSKFGLAKKPIEAIPLAHASNDGKRETIATWGKTISFLRNRPFVLMVSTIEARKNHMYLVLAWKSMIDEGLNPPDLVFVGRVGWHVSSLMEYLETTRNLANRVHILQDLSDAELDTLYSGSLYTVFPSYIEGWGLPVGESLAHGKPCVASSTSSIPEVGGDLVDYLDPFNLRGGLEVLRRMTFDTAYRVRRQKDIVENFIPRTWLDVGRSLLEAVDQIAPVIKPDTLPDAKFPSGLSFQPSGLLFGKTLPEDYARNPTRLMLSGSWYGIEEIGCWMKGSDAWVSFKSDLEAGTSVVIYLHLFGAPLSDLNLVTAFVAADYEDSPKPEDRSIQIRSNASFHIRVDGKVGSAGIVILGLTVSGVIKPEHNDLTTARTFALGLSSICYCAREDVLMRLDIQERIIGLM